MPVGDGEALAGVVAAPAPAPQEDFAPCVKIRRAGYVARVAVAADKPCGKPHRAAAVDEQHREVAAGPLACLQRHFRGLRLTLLPPDDGQPLLEHHGQHAGVHRLIPLRFVCRIEGQLAHRDRRRVGRKAVLLEPFGEVGRVGVRQGAVRLGDQVAKRVGDESVDYRARFDRQVIGLALEPRVGDDVAFRIEVVRVNLRRRVDRQVVVDNPDRRVGSRMQPNDVRFEADGATVAVRGAVVNG